MDNWYYALNGAQQGPVSKAALQQMLASGQLPAETLVWREGMANWIPAHTVPELVSDTGEIPFAPSNDPVPQHRQMPVMDPVLPYGKGESMYDPVGQVLANYAGFWIRFGAWFIDYIVTYAIGSVVGFVEGTIVGVTLGHARGVFGIAGGIGGVLGIIIGWLYFSLMHSSSRQASLGMMACGLRVTDMNGNRITFGRATGRYFASILSGLILGIGYLIIIWSPRKRALHDELANTLVLTK